MIHLSYDDVKRLAREVITEQGADFVYNTRPGSGSCFYLPIGEMNSSIVQANHGRPDMRDANSPKHKTGCIVGQMLIKAGVPKFRLQQMKSICLLLGDLYDLEVLSVSGYAASAALTILQTHQDGGASWGEAFKAAFGEEV